MVEMMLTFFPRTKFAVNGQLFKNSAIAFIHILSLPTYACRFKHYHFKGLYAQPLIILLSDDFTTVLT